MQYVRTFPPLSAVVSSAFPFFSEGFFLSLEAEPFAISAGRDSSAFSEQVAKGLWLEAL